MLTVHLKPSKLLAAILIVAHCAAALIIGLLSVTTDIKLAGMLAVIVSAFFYLRRDALQHSAYSVTLLRFSDKVECTLETKCGQILECKVCGSTFVSFYLTVLILRSQQSWLTRSIVILPDAMDSEEFRRLRVLLRWKWKQVVEKDA